MTSQTITLAPTTLQISIQIPYELLLKLATFGVILIAAWIASKVLGTFLLKAVGKLSPNAAQRIKRIVTWLIWLIGILIGLHQLGLELTVLLLVLAVGAITFIFAFRDILSNVASHEIINIYQPFKLGEWIQIGKYFGRVVDITWMDTIIITPDNEMVYIPNSNIIKSIVINKTAPRETRISVPITIDNTLDLSTVEKTLLEIADELKGELAPDAKPEVRVTKIDNQNTKLELLLKINNPAKSVFIPSEVRKKAKIRLDEIRKKKTPQ